MNSIGIDLDGVCADFTGKFYELSRQLFGLPKPGYIQTRWDYDYLTKEQDNLVWDCINGTENFWESLSPEHGTNLLRDAQQYFHLYFVTSRSPTVGLSVEQQCMRWLHDKFDIKYPQVLVKKTKAPLVKALGLSAFIDDKPSQCRDVAYKAEKCAVYMRNQTYNLIDSNLERYKITRVPTLDAFLEVLS